MSKAEKFIIEHTSVLKDSNGKEYFKWLTPDQAREAVEIAREEMIEKVYKYLYKHLFELWEASCPTIDDFMEKFKQAMKDE